MGTNYKWACKFLVSDCQLTVRGSEDNYTSIEWPEVNEHDKPTKSECDAVASSAEQLKQNKLIENELKYKKRSKHQRAFYMLARFVKSKHPDMPQALKDILIEVGEN